ncbi:MAG: Crp/Fnr family transcriptional regulator [Candidatus Howiella sp.]
MQNLGKTAPLAPYYALLRRAILFRGIDEEDIARLFGCLHCRVQDYEKGEYLFLADERITAAGILLEGRTCAESPHLNGEQSIVQTFAAGEMFGDLLMSGGSSGSPVNMRAAEDCRILFLPFDRIMDGCAENCAAHRQLRVNLLTEISEKFFRLNRKIRYLSNRSLRCRIAEFLLDCMSDAGGRTFNTSLSREDLAALLGANRSALSRELSRMQADGILSFYKSSFKIEDADKLRDCFR